MLKLGSSWHKLELKGAFFNSRMDSQLELPVIEEQDKLVDWFSPESYSLLGGQAIC